LRTVADAVNASQRPVLVIGSAVARDGAAEAALRLAEIMQAPAWSAPHAGRSAFPENHPLFAGFLPAAPEPLFKMLAGHDLILVLGAPAFTFHVPGNLKLAESGPPIYQITDDAETAATALATTSVLGTMRLAITALTKDVAPKEPRFGKVRARIERLSAADPIAAAFVLQTIADLRQSDSVIVEEAPSHKQALQQHLPIHNCAFYAMASGGLGYGLAAAAGLALADPSRHVICVVGDGSAMYSIQALWTAARHGLAITYVILNNGGYGAMRAFSHFMKSKDPPGIDLPLLDFVALAHGHGCKASRVTRAAELAPALRQAFATAAPTLVEVVVDRAVPRLFAAD
jgi:benzoylformate decarboxylase